MDFNEASRLMRLSRDRITSLTRAYGRGERYATTSRFKRHAGKDTEAKLVRVRGAGARTLFQPGDARGFPRYWSGDTARWYVDVDEAAAWTVRHYAIDGYAKLVEFNRGLEWCPLWWQAALLRAMEGLTREAQ